LAQIGHRQLSLLPSEMLICAGRKPLIVAVEMVNYYGVLKRNSTGPAQPTRLIMDTSDATEGPLYALPRALSAMERPPEAEPVSAANTLVATRHERSALNLRFTRND